MLPCLAWDGRAAWGHRVTVRGDRVNIAFKGSEGTNKNFTLYFTFVKFSQIVQSVYQS